MEHGPQSAVVRNAFFSVFVFFGVWGGVGMMTFVGLAHMVDATQVMGWGGGWGGDDDVPRTCTHGGCYASDGVGWGVGWG